MATAARAARAAVPVARAARVATLEWAAVKEVQDRVGEL